MCTANWSAKDVAMAKADIENLRKKVASHEATIEKQLRLMAELETQNDDLYADFVSLAASVRALGGYLFDITGDNSISELTCDPHLAYLIEDVNRELGYEREPRDCPTPGSVFVVTREVLEQYRQNGRDECSTWVREFAELLPRGGKMRHVALVIAHAIEDTELWS